MEQPPNKVRWAILLTLVLSLVIFLVWWALRLKHEWQRLLVIELTLLPTMFLVIWSVAAAREAITHLRDKRRGCTQARDRATDPES